MNTAAIEARLRAFFEDEPTRAVAVYLFGSVARDDARPGSDVDVGVLFGEDPPATLEAPQFAIEVRRRNEYFDLAPIRRLYRAYPPPSGNASARLAGPRR